MYIVYIIEVIGQWYSKTTVWNEIGFLSKIIHTRRIGSAVYYFIIIIIIQNLYIYIYNTYIYFMGFNYIQKRNPNTWYWGPNIKLIFSTVHSIYISSTSRLGECDNVRTRTTETDMTFIEYPNNHKPNGFSTALRSLEDKRNHNNNVKNILGIFTGMVIV